MPVFECSASAPCPATEVCRPERCNDYCPPAACSADDNFAINPCCFEAVRAICEAGSPVLDGTPCNDGNACTGPDPGHDVCQTGECKAGPMKDCTIGKLECQDVTGCNSADGKCQYKTDRCDCTPEDASKCNDNDACTEDPCGPDLKCLEPHPHAPDGTECPGANPCNSGYACAAGDCVPAVVGCGGACDARCMTGVGCVPLDAYGAALCTLDQGLGQSLTICGSSIPKRVMNRVTEKTSTVRSKIDLAGRSTCCQEKSKALNVANRKAVKATSFVGNKKKLAESCRTALLNALQQTQEKVQALLKIPCDPASSVCPKKRGRARRSATGPSVR